MYFSGESYDFNNPVPMHGIEMILNILLKSPVQKILLEYQGTFNLIHKYVGYLNWFVPIGWILDLLVAWLGAIAIFYGVMALLRWVKLIGD